MQKVRIFSKDCYKKKRRKTKKKKKRNCSKESLISYYFRHVEDEFIFKFISRGNH